MIHATTRQDTIKLFQTIFEFITERQMSVPEMLWRLRDCPPDSITRLVHAIAPLVECHPDSGEMRVRFEFVHEPPARLATLAWRHLLQQDTFHQQDQGMHPSQ